MDKNNPLYAKADALAKQVYKAALNFPKHEMYGLTSQLRRAVLSVVLNIIEGFARQSKAEFRRFLLISFGSLEETRYILEFSLEQKYITNDQYVAFMKLIDEVAKIIWSITKKNKE